MNISYDWLKRYLDFDLEPERLAEVLTSVGLETDGVECVESIKGGLKGVVIGKVLTCVEHPDSDHLHITTVDLGDGAATQIVCGAPNVAAGQTVVVATVGTTLYDGDKEFKIKKSKIRGVESLGMICAEDEIGVGTSHDGIMVIKEDIAPGTPAAEYFNLTNDYVLEVDLTPNRIDAASHYGVARDLAAWLKAHTDKNPELHRPSVEAYHMDKAEGGIPVSVEAPQACTRYAGVTVRGIKVGPSPEWLQKLLLTIGQRPINNVVDITNFLLHSFCQPLHCFDLAKVKGDQIIVKTCPQGTKFTTLDGVERTLDAADLCICNAEEPMCIAGVFGGLDSGVTETTESVFLESACFNATSVRRTARRHGLSTDASFRFERGVDPNNVVYVLKLCAMMVKELAGGEICGEIVDIYPNVVKPAEVELDLDKMAALIGKTLPKETIEVILEGLEMQYQEKSDKVLDVKVPTYRVDVTRPCDVIEDVLRIYGYNNVEFGMEMHASLSYKTLTDAADDLRRTIANQLTAQGYNEILNNSLTAEAYYADLTTYPASHCVKLLNPLSQDLNVMRQTLLFGGLETLAHNINRKLPDLALYEFGNVYSFYGQEVEGQPLAQYHESASLALWLSGNIARGNWARQAQESTIFDLKAAVANIFGRLGIEAQEVKLTQMPANDIFSAYLSVTTKSGKEFGQVGLVSKAILKKTDIDQPVAYAQLDWMALVKLANKRNVTFAPLAKTPAVKRDLALLLDNAVTFDQVLDVVRSTEKRLLRSVELFDVYEGKNLPAGKKSYAITMTLQDPEKTLNDKFIDAVMSKIVKQLQDRLGAQLR